MRFAAQGLRKPRAKNLPPLKVEIRHRPPYCIIMLENAIRGFACGGTPPILR